MSFLDTMLDLTDAFVSGYNAVTGMGPQGYPLIGRGSDEERGRIERLCRELGWGVDGREGGAILLRFNHAELGPRDVRVMSGDECLALFLVYSHALPPADNVTEEVVGYLLHQNVTAAPGCWFADVLQDGRAIFGLRYDALGAALDPPTLKFICEKMVAEVLSFDAWMKAEGLLA
jgi:hypothetical protein